MRSTHWIIAAALVGTPALAAAQAQTMIPTTTAQIPSTSTSTLDPSLTHWRLSGFAGSTFGGSTSDAGVDFGGQIAYLTGGIIGAEFIAAFAPTFKINNALLTGDANVNSYMVNAIGVVPFGAEKRFQPYVSGGMGGIQTRSAVFNIAATPASGITASNQTKSGGDIGVGVMGFAGHVGMRADVRYYRVFLSTRVNDTTAVPDNSLTENLLPVLAFWKTNVGVVFRW